MSPEQFWDLTYYELQRKAVGKQTATEVHQQIALLSSWYTAALGRSKKMPELKTYLNSFRRDQREQFEKARKAHRALLEHIDNG